MERLVGRGAELAAIERFLDGVRGGYSVLALEGGAGYGKTALLEAGVGRAAAGGATVLRAQPAEAEADVAFGVLADLLGPLVDEAGLDLAEPAPRALAIALRRADADGEPVDPLAIGLGVLSLLRRARGPVVVALDDLQWCDTPSARALEFGLRRLGPEPLGLLVSIRTTDQPPYPLPAPRERVTRIEIGPLAEPAFVALIHEHAPGLPLPALRRLHLACDGNPLFGLEVAGRLGKQPVRAGEPLPVPPTVADALNARVSRLAPQVRELLVAAAALAKPTAALLEAAFPEADVEAALEPAIAAGLIATAGERLRFSHPLVAAAVYRSASRRRLRAVHARLAATHEDEEERAAHLALSVVGPDEQVARALEAAARSARARGAPDGAAQLLERSAAATPPEDVATIHRRTLDAARNHFVAGDPHHARELLEALVDVPAPPARRAEALLELARATENDLGVASEHAYAALDLAAEEAVVEIQIRHFLANLHYGAGDAPRGAEHAYAARRAAESSGSESLRAAAIAMVASVDAWLGKPVDLEELERAAEIERRVGRNPGLESRPLIALADHLKRIGRYERARGLHEEDLAAARRAGDVREAASVLTGLADIEARSGNLELAIRHATDIADLGEQLGDAALASNGLLHRAGCLALLGRLEESAVDEATAREVAEAAEIEAFLASLDHTRGLIELGRDSPATALEHFDRCERRLDDSGIVHPGYRKLPTGIEAALLLGQLDEAERQIRVAEARCTPERDARVLMVTARYRGLLASLGGKHEPAESAFAKALELHEVAPSAYELAHTLLALGTARRRSKRRADARDVLERAAALFETVGAAAWVERARAEAKALGLRRSSGDELTPMERQVAAVVARGVTTREAAASLFVTPKTIEFHLRNVYRKLGVRSRGELANAVRPPS